MNLSTLKHLKLAALVLAMTLPAGHSLVAENMNPIEWCSRAGSESARIICLEEALRNRTGQTPNISTPAQATVPQNTSVADPARSDNGTQTTQTATSTQKQTETALDKLGKEEAKKHQGEDLKENERLAAHVSSFKFAGYRKLWVKLDNGQIWQQKKSDRSSLEAKLKRFEEFDVELWRTGFGGYRLHIPVINKTLAVNRLN